MHTGHALPGHRPPHHDTAAQIQRRDSLGPLQRTLCTSLARAIDRFSGRPAERKCLILIFHRVLDQPDEMMPSEPDVATFRWQMALLARYFNVLPLDEALARMDNGRLPRRAACITFDDGYADNLHNAMPVLRDFDLPATCFVTSGFLDGGRMWNDTVIEALRRLPGERLHLNEFGIDLGDHPLTSLADRRRAAEAIIRRIKHLDPALRQRLADLLGGLADDMPTDLMLSKGQLIQLERQGMEIGGHTVSHPILAKLDAATAEAEIADGKRALEGLLRKEIRFFAYPNGRPGEDYLPEHAEMVQRCGFQAAVSTVWGVASRSSDRYQLPRFSPWDARPVPYMLRLLRAYAGRL